MPLLQQIPADQIIIIIIIIIIIVRRKGEDGQVRATAIQAEEAVPWL